MDVRPLQNLSANASPEVLRKKAAELVAQTFFGTLLKQMRSSPLGNDLFNGGRGGQAYNSLFDQQIVTGLSRGVGQKLIDSIVKSIDPGVHGQRHVSDASETSRSSGATNVSVNSLSNEVRRHGSTDLTA